VRFQSLLLLLALCMALPARAQNTDYPTLDALAKLNVPAFRYTDMLGRMASSDPSYKAPAEPPQYEIGDLDFFWLDFGENYNPKYVKVELRGMTRRVLIWADTTVDYPNWRAQALARQLESAVLDPTQRIFQFAEPPGVDGDARLTVAMIHDPDGTHLGYFSRRYALPKKLRAHANQREMLVVNLALDDEYDFYDEILLDVIAHEYLHILHYHSDFGEELWLDEALASYAGFQASKPYLSRSTGHIVADEFLAAPGVGLTQWQAVEDKSTKYGAGLLFIMYLTQRFGQDILPPLLADPANGWASVAKVLNEEAGAFADEVFADWVLANYFLNVHHGYGYRELDADLTPPEPSAAYNSFPASHESRLPQYSTDYIAVDARGAETLLMRLWQAPEARLVSANTGDGNHFYYAMTSDKSNSSLTRAFDLTAVNKAWLEYKVWYDLEDDIEYGFVTVSADGGETWDSLTGILMSSSDIYEDYYARGYTGRLANWITDRVNLSAYAPGQVLIRFEVLSGYGTSYRGMAIDDLRIKAIDFADDFETDDAAWIAEGWLRTDNRLPNRTWLQAVQESRDGLHVSRALLTGDGELRMEILPGVSQVLVALSPVVPGTGLPADYELELYLLDAAGEVMVVSRECTVTTTHVLNFRDGPNGTKIGLVPEGAALDALDREGDWYMVEHAGRQGWIHGDYVHKAGKCP